MDLLLLLWKKNLKERCVRGDCRGKCRKVKEKRSLNSCKFTMKTTGTGPLNRHSVVVLLVTLIGGNRWYLYSLLNLKSKVDECGVLSTCCHEADYYSCRMSAGVMLGLADEETPNPEGIIANLLKPFKVESKQSLIRNTACCSGCDLITNDSFEEKINSLGFLAIDWKQPRSLPCWLWQRWHLHWSVVNCGGDGVRDFRRGSSVLSIICSHPKLADRWMIVIYMY